MFLNQPVCRASKGAYPRPVPAGEDRAPTIQDLAGMVQSKSFTLVCVGNPLGRERRRNEGK